jgi:hypothetical protein
MRRGGGAAAAAAAKWRQSGVMPAKAVMAKNASQRQQTPAKNNGNGESLESGVAKNGGVMSLMWRKVINR